MTGPGGFDEAMWERIDRDQLGIDMIDPLGHDIGRAEAKGGPGGPWRPVDGRKHVLVGELDDYFFYDGDGAEADWNLNITPAAPFRDLLDRVVAMMSPSDRDELVRRKRGSGFCIQCEVTPDEHFYGNRYFPKSGANTSMLEGQQIGLYGPWVQDCGHGNRPEIHPAEVLWWRRIGFLRPRNRTVWTVMVLQDDSNRYDRATDFDGPIDRPWSKSPRRADITVALRFPRDELTRYHIFVEYQRNVAVIEDDAPVTVDAEFRDETVVRVRKRFSDPGKIRVRLGRVDPDGDHLRCFATLSVRLGEGDRGKEGYLVFRIEEIPFDPNPGPAEPPEDIVPRPGITPDPEPPRDPGDGPPRHEP